MGDVGAGPPRWVLREPASFPLEPSTPLHSITPSTEDSWQAARGSYSMGRTSLSHAAW